MSGSCLEVHPRVEAVMCVHEYFLGEANFLLDPLQKHLFF